MIEFLFSKGKIHFILNENLFIINEKIYLTDESEYKNGDYVVLLIDNKFELSMIHTLNRPKNAYKVIACNYDLINLPKINIFDTNITELYVQGYYEMTDGWVPSYNNPDNNNLDEPAEPTGRIILDLDENNKVIIYE